MPYLFSVLSLLLAGYSMLRKESREDREKKAAAAALRDERLKLLESKFEGHELRLTGFNQEHERHCDTVARKFESQDQRLSEIPPLREGMVGIRAKMDYMTEGLGKLENKIDRLIERLTKQP